jgi:hypothetical protein
MPYGGFSPVRLQGQPVRSRLPGRHHGEACSRHARSVDQCASTLRTLPLRAYDPALCPGPPAPPRAAVREARASLPQGSLAPVRVLLSRPILAYSDPIRRSRRHAAMSRPSRLYATPSLSGSTSATRETFPAFPVALSIRAVDPTPVGPRPPPVVRAPRYQASSCYDRVATHEARLCQPCLTGIVFRRCIVRVMLRPVCLPGPPGWLRRHGALCAPTPPSEAPCHPRFSRRPSPDAVGSQASSPPAPRTRGA